LNVCCLCGNPLVGRRSDARHCCDSHRAEANRLRRLLGGEQVGPYRSVADRLKAARSRNSALIGVDAEAHATYDDCGTSKWGGTARTARPRTPGGTPDAK